MKSQTAVEFLESRIKVLIPEDIGSQLMFKSNVTKAKTMETEQFKQFSLYEHKETITSYDTPTNLQIHSSQNEPTDEEIQSEFTCEMEDCPHCAYEEQQMYEENLEKEAAVDFGEWLLKECGEFTTIPMEQLYQLYLKS